MEHGEQTPAPPFVHLGVQGRDRRAVPAGGPVVGWPGCPRFRPDRDRGLRLGQAGRAGRRYPPRRRPDHGGAALAGGSQVALSVGCTSQCRDNALAESFFASIKGGLIDTQPWPTLAAARRVIVECIGWYNSTRLHSALGYSMSRRIREQPLQQDQKGSLTESSALSVKAG